MAIRNKKKKEEVKVMRNKHIISIPLLIIIFILLAIIMLPLKKAAYEQCKGKGGVLVRDYCIDKKVILE